MREILFRGKNYKIGKWAYGLLEKKYAMKDCDIHYIRYPAGNEESDFGYSRVIPETVGQYTGLKDKNEVKIFEGDIVKVHDALIRSDEKYHEFKGLVEYRENGFGISDGDFYHLRWFAYEMEVIGNITDNLELLGAE